MGLTPGSSHSSRRSRSHSATASRLGRHHRHRHTGFALAVLFIVSGSFLVVVVAHYLINALEFIVHEGFDRDWASGLEGETNAHKRDSHS